ncbi:Rpn family recombination-promoting nuclease/putative transposase [Pluralibacter gergoviae]|uniref:Rpn family recombination-promoting nuclease/putative transposase n=1 Tax=Pluralibacter gergoviae TaxID=61647 RepID=UPI003BA2C8E8
MENDSDDIRRSPTPHDSTFKQFLTHPDTARDFMQLHLPADLQALCDFSTLKLESGSFIEDNLRPYFSDVLYSLKTVNHDDSYIHVLIEHQSTPDRHMAFRLLRYAVAAMQRHLEAGHSRLPLVIPVLFYAGRRTPYPWSTRWLDDFHRPEIAERLYRGAFPLVDVTIIPDDEIMEHRSMAALTLLQKHIHRRNLAELTDRLVTLLCSEYMTGQQLASLINYAIQVGDTPDAEGFVHQLARRVPQHEDALMTIAQQLEQKGVEKGIQLGKLEMARALVQQGMDLNTVARTSGFTPDELMATGHQAFTQYSSEQ